MQHYSVASISKTPQNRYRVHYRDGSGKSQTKTFVVKSEAEGFRTEVDHDKLTSSLVDRSLSKLTVHDFARGWFDSLTVKPKTRDSYRDKYNTWVMPRWGDVPVGKVERSDIQAWAMSITDQYQRSQSTRDQAVNSLRGVLNFAVDKRAIKVNPALKMKLPQLPKQHEMQCLGMDEIKALAAAAAHRPNQKQTYPVHPLIIEFAAFTGVRAGELWALRWMDVDFDAATIHVTRSMAVLADSSIVVGLTKNSKGRKISIPQWLADRLRRHYFVAGSPNAALPVFPNADGTPMRHSNFWNRVFRPATIDIGRPTLRFHDLRHTYASMLIANGADPKIVQKRLGHANISITFDIYGHVFPEKDQGITEALGSLYLDAERASDGNGVVVPLR